MKKTGCILLICAVITLLAPAAAGYAIDIGSLIGQSSGNSIDQVQFSQWVGVDAVDIGSITLDDGKTGSGFLYENVSAEDVEGCIGQLDDLGYDIQELDTDDDTAQYYLTKSDQQLLLVIYLGDDNSTINMAVVFVGGTENVTSQFESMKTNTLVADVNGKTTEFEINISHNSGSGQMVDFVKKDVRGIVLEGITLSLPGVIFVGDVIDSNAYNAERYGLCGIIYYNRREASAQEAYNTKNNCDYMARITYDANYSTVDEFFNPSMKPIMQPNAGAAFTIYCDYMSVDGNTYGGRVEALLIRGTDGKELTIKNGYFKFSVR